jgi:large subunit ribosomal protein L2
MNLNKEKGKLVNKIIKINKFIFKKPLIKKSIKGLIKTGGRNNIGKITIRHIGKGHKRKYRKINFYRIKQSIGIIFNIEYDPNRNSNIAAIYDFYNNNFFYVLATKNLKIGDILKSSYYSKPKLGYSLPINQIPIGSYIHSVKLKSSKFAKISRAAGTFSQLKEKTLNYAIIKLSSGKYKQILSKNHVTIGIVSNELIFLSKLKKAGQSVWLNKKSKVRGVAMNPVDHPHGGGEGKKSGKKKTP